MFPDYTPCVPVFLRELVARHGDRSLIVLDERRESYREAERRSARLARALLAAGVGKGTRVGVLMPNGPDWVVCWLAATRIGAVLVPINTFFQQRELRWVLRHADVHTLLCVRSFLQHDYVERLEQCAPELSEATSPELRLPSLPQLRSVFVWGSCERAFARDGEQAIRDAGADAAIDDDFLHAVEATVTPADPMVVLYSSGSTAEPKGAIHTHGSVIRHSFNLGSRRDLNADDRIWSPMPFFWVGGFVFALIGAMHVGACLLCEEVFEPEKTLRFLERERATVAAAWPHFGKALADHPTRGDRDLSSLRGGNVPDILGPDLVDPDPLRRPNALGMTETCGPHTYAATETLPEALRGSFGTPAEGVEHKIIDPETGRELPPGESGEICVRGYNLMQGLHKLEREAVFEADGFYRTGDAGYFDENGVLYFQARLGEMIKTGGANVTPAEVEQALCAFDEVKAAHVVGLPDPERGQRVAAAVVLEPQRVVDVEELRRRLKQQIAAYKVPQVLHIVSASDLPFTDSGKIDKRAVVTLLQKLQG